MSTEQSILAVRTQYSSLLAHLWLTTHQYDSTKTGETKAALEHCQLLYTAPWCLKWPLKRLCGEGLQARIQIYRRKDDKKSKAVQNTARLMNLGLYSRQQMDVKMLAEKVPLRNPSA
ncbi:unnamed protein product [Hymenolepis diminuta]|uniref:FAT domain-containing protein n=1 Tax=Hymenolepis diminuta TaxID=6216 RepID=A0A0R3SLN1_HYMDI|nr:unnamed protein product [Hymenolepis diminuta]